MSMCLWLIDEPKSDLRYNGCMQQRFYKDLAYLYDIVYSDKDYKKESEKLLRQIRQYKKSRGSDLLEVACGTGSFLKYLKKNFRCTGVDVNPEMLKIAKKKVSGITLKKANMMNMNLKKKFDVVVCLFSSIGYAKTQSNLKKVMKVFANHLKPGGVCIVHGFITPAQFIPGSKHVVVREEKDIAVVRMAAGKRKGKVATFNFNFLVFKRGKGIEHFVDRHVLGLFEHREVLAAMEKAGLRAKHVNKNEKKNGIYVGVKS